jgi:hypothetical protein
MFLFMRRLSIDQSDKELLKEVSQNSLSPVFRQRATCILLAIVALRSWGFVSPKLSIKH